MTTTGTDRGRFRRLLGLPATRRPNDDGCWIYSEGRLVVDLSRAGELRHPGGAIRLEGGELPIRVLVVHGGDGFFHAYRNQCGHRGRRVDPSPSGRRLRCCGAGRSTYDASGRILAGPATRRLRTCPARRMGDRLIVTLKCPSLVRSRLIEPLHVVM